MDPNEANRVVCELFETRYPALVRYVYRSLGNLGAAEDIVQEAFLDLYKQLVRGAAIEHPSAWAFSVARRRISREIRRHRETTALHERLEVLDFAPQGQIHPAPFALEGADLIRVSALSRREEEVLLLRMDALKYKEIGQILGISTGCVGALITRALQKLRTQTDAAPRENARRYEAL